MADEPEDDVLDLTEGMQEEGEQQPEPPEPEDEDLSLEIEGEDQEEDTPTIRQLRQRLRDSERELHETRKAQMQPAQKLGAKPTLESCEFDDERYERELDAWKDAERAEKDRERRETEQVQQRNQQFERARGRYQAQAATLRIKGFEEAEKNVLGTLGPDFLGAIVQYADDPAKLVGALGNTPSALAKVAAEPDPMRQFKMLIDMEKRIKMPQRNAPPPPEADTIQRGTAPVARAAPDKKLAQLEAQADKTGDRTELIRYKMQQKKGERA